jgi:hypothetical protein
MTGGGIMNPSGAPFGITSRHLRPVAGVDDTIAIGRPPRWLAPTDVAQTAATRSTPRPPTGKAARQTP